jgi:hypothetical protein
MFLVKNAFRLHAVVTFLPLVPIRPDSSRAQYEVQMSRTKQQCLLRGAE